MTLTDFSQTSQALLSPRAAALLLGVGLLTPACFAPPSDVSPQEVEMGASTGSTDSSEDPTTGAPASSGHVDETTGGAETIGDASTAVDDDTTGGDDTTGDDDDTTGDRGSAETTGTPEPAVCGDGLVEGDEACDDGTPDGTDFCNDCALAPALSLDGIHELDTDAGTLDGVPLEGWNEQESALYLSALDLLSTGVVRAVGSHPLRVYVDGDVAIVGVLDLSGGPGGMPGETTPDCDSAGLGGTPGAGGFAGGAGGGFDGSGLKDGSPGEAPADPAGGGRASTSTTTQFPGIAGGGGGGHASAGQPGNAFPLGGSIPGAAGAAYPSLPDLLGGGGGGGGSVFSLSDGPLLPPDLEGAGGGGGGGAVLLTSTGSITVSGVIDASGGDGGGNVEGGLCTTDVGGGGGGAGGSIHLVAPSINTPGVLDVGGGAGAIALNPNNSFSNGGDGSDGRILTEGVGD